MAVAGIVAEYNPFHRGHAYHLQQAKLRSGAEAAVAVMSGHFVQRGEPALLDKWARAEMALHGGVDLVFELPFAWAVRSAYYFARGALLCLAATGVVTHLCFGAEADSLDLLLELAAILADEPEPFREELKAALARGVSFPAARALAVAAFLRQPGHAAVAEQALRTMASPNNILALEYLKVIRQESLPLVPVLIPRRGPGYHDLSPGPWASASAVRAMCREADWSDRVGASLPPSSLEVMRREFALGRGPVFPEALDLILLALLRRASLEELRRIADVTEGLENRIKKAARTSTSLAELTEGIKSRRYNLTRIQRVLLHALLQVTAADLQAYDHAGPSYLHVLGFSPRGQKILLRTRKAARIFLLTRVAPALRGRRALQDPAGRAMLELDLLATDLYALLRAPGQRHAGGDFTTAPVRID
ncbi:MAG: nucleotidyltransferase [Syntrophomonadaceae bacterium]|nr:nucleotidyltransferase [Syntrophomonadaceae bacterium]